MLALLGGSLVAVMALAGIAWLLRLGGTPQIAHGDEAARIAEEMLSGFEARRSFVSADRLTALVLGIDGSVAVIRPNGARFLARRVARPAFRRTEDGALEVESGDRRPVTIRLESPAKAAELAQVLAAG